MIFRLITHALPNSSSSLFLSSPHPPSPQLSFPVVSSHRSMFERLPLTGESAVGSLLIIQPQRGRVTEGDALIVIGQLWTPAPPTCKRGQRSNKSSQAQQGRGGGKRVRQAGGEGREEGGCQRWRGEVGHAGSALIKYIDIEYFSFIEICEIIFCW